jgi:hypothetical protein
MRIVSPAYKYRFGADPNRAGADSFNSLLCRWSPAGNKSIGKAQENEIARVETEFLYGPLCLRFPQLPKRILRIDLAPRMGSRAVADDDYPSGPMLTASFGDQAAARQTLVVRMGRDDEQPAAAEHVA